MYDVKIKVTIHCCIIKLLFQTDTQNHLKYWKLFEIVLKLTKFLSKVKNETDPEDVPATIPSFFKNDNSVTSPVEHKKKVYCF